MIGPDVIELKPFRKNDAHVVVRQVPATPQLGVPNGRRVSCLIWQQTLDSSEWCLTADKRYPGKYGKSCHRYSHHATGAQLVIMDDHQVLCLRVNASRLAHGAKHNGRIVRDQQQLDDVIRIARGLLDPLLTNHEYEFTVSCIEFGGVVEVPFADFEALLAGRNYPGAKTKPMRFQGESLAFGTSRKSTFHLSIYDKGIQLTSTGRLPASGGRFTRIEFRLSKEQISKYFGGDAVADVTIEKMRQIFFQLFYRLEKEGKTVNTTPKGICGCLVRMMQMEAEHPDPERERVADWYLRTNGDTAYRRKLIAEAQNTAAKLRSRSLRQLVPLDAPFVDLD